MEFAFFRLSLPLDKVFFMLISSTQNQSTPVMKKMLLGLFIVGSFYAQAQSAGDLFAPGTKITWLGVDFSHVKLIGDFNTFKDAGAKSMADIKKTYFPSWNGVVLKEREKYDLKKMLRKDDITYSTEMITAINEQTPTENMEGKASPNYSTDDVQKFVETYKPTDADGIGIVFIAESMDKNAESGTYHFVAFSLKSKKVLIQERIQGKAGGFGLRNYWARSIFEVMQEITKKNYKAWQKKYGNG